MNDHMSKLDEVAAADILHLQEKERTYKGSWKKRGGVGAFMMLARKWDRLESMLESTQSHGSMSDMALVASKYDIFAHCSKDMSGADGTVLAEVRDLRRYLMLVEAEMLARHVEPSEFGKSHLSPAQQIMATDKAAERLVPRRVDHPAPFGCQEEKPGSPADGGHHALGAYRLVEEDWLVLPEEDKVLYGGKTTIGRTLLENPPASRVSLASAEYRKWYIWLEGDHCILDRRLLEPEDLEKYRRIPKEKNWKEWDSLSDAQRDMYKESKGKYRLKPEFAEAWGAQA